MSETQLTKADLLEGLYKLEINVTNKLAEFQNDYRSRITDIERKFLLDLKELEARVNDKIDKLREELVGKTDVQRANSSEKWVTFFVTTGVNLGVAALVFLYNHLK